MESFMFSEVEPKVFRKSGLRISVAQGSHNSESLNSVSNFQQVFPENMLQSLTLTFSLLSNSSLFPDQDCMQVLKHQ